ncbi:MAG: serine protease [Kiritimatiellia bacterium]
MNKHGWADAATLVRDYVVKIETPDSYGSGFLISYRDDLNTTRKLVIATAYHVVEHALKWSEVIRITKNNVQVQLLPGEREILTLESRDLALVIIDVVDTFSFPDKVLPAINPKAELPPGLPVGWSGFPNIADNHNCFFAGHISAAIDDSGDYYVDGVVIHGVSGAPAFIEHDDEVLLIGLISAYLPNRASGEALPGMTVIRSVNPFTEYFHDENVQAKKSVKKQRPTRGKKGRK